MKKVISSLIVMSMVFCASVAKADNITVGQAKAIGAYYMGHEMGIDKLSPEQLTLVYEFRNPELDVASAYVFNVNDCGWIIIAGSSAMDPVIAFSEEGLMDMKSIPDNLRWWLTSYTDVVADIQRIDAEKDLPDSKEYTILVNNGLNGTKDETNFYLMKTAWGQGSSYSPSYNYYCPQYNGRYCVTGCMATALAQMCKYYNYPVQPKGTVSTTFHGERLEMNLDTISFDYTQMPLTLIDANYNIIASMDQVREVAKLNYSLGVAVKMDYDPDGSGALTNNTLSAMRYKFKYQSGTNRHRSGTSDTNFVNTIFRYLINGDVVLMTGSSSTGSGGDAAGHAWVVDGYRSTSTKKYHMNWGWSGTGNGWYNLDDNSMYISSQGYNFNVNQACLFGMLPPEDSNIYHSHVSIREVDNTVLGTAYPNPATMSVTLPYTTETAADMQVYGIDGKLIATRRVQPGCGEVTLRVDALPKGVYIYRLNSQSGKFIVK